MALVHADAQAAIAGTARVDRSPVTQTLVVLTTGISTAATRAAMAESLLAITNDRGAGGVVLGRGLRSRWAPRP